MSFWHTVKIYSNMFYFYKIFRLTAPYRWTRSSRRSRAAAGRRRPVAALPEEGRGSR